MFNRLVGDGKLAKIMTNHLRLNFNLVKGLSVVDTNVGTNKLRNNDHVAQVSLNDLRFVFLRGACSSSLLNTLDQSHRLVLKTTEDLATRASRQELEQALAINFKKLLKLDSTVGKLAESSFLLQIGSVVNLIVSKLFKWSLLDGWKMQEKVHWKTTNTIVDAGVSEDVGG